jgi:hypothetical protein
MAKSRLDNHWHGSMRAQQRKPASNWDHSTFLKGLSFSAINLGVTGRRALDGI